MNDLYRETYTNKTVESSFTFDDAALKKALKRIYEKDVNPMNDIEENLFNAVFKTMSDAVDKGFGVPESTDPDTDFYKALKSDAAVFSAFKTHRWQNDIARQMLDEKGNLKSFEQFRQDVASMVDPQHKDAWLRTEYDTAILRARQAAEWKQFEREKDILPNLRWVESTSIHPGADHRRFWGVIRPIDDQFWSVHRPGDRWNCKCTLSATDEPPTPEANLPAGEKGDKPAPGLGSNPGKTGQLFSKDHPYVTGAYKGAKEAVEKFILEMEKKFVSPKMPEALRAENEYLKDKKIVFKKKFFDLIDDTPGRDVRFQIDKKGSTSYYMPDASRVRDGRKIVEVPEHMRRMVHILDNARNKASDWHRESVVYHEFGHAIDAQRNLYTSERLKGLMARQRLSLNKKQTYSMRMETYNPETNGFDFVVRKVSMSRIEYADKRLENLQRKLFRMNEKTFTRRGITKDDVMEQICSTRDTIKALNVKYGFGHSTAYFQTPGMSEKEFIAHCFENAFAGNKVFKKYLPELYTEMVNYIREIKQ